MSSFLLLASEHIWGQGICSHHDEFDRSVHNKSDATDVYPPGAPFTNMALCLITPMDTSIVQPL